MLYNLSRIFLIEKKQAIKLFNELIKTIEQPDLSRSPEWGLIDAILEHKPEILEHMNEEILPGNKEKPTAE